MSHPYGGEYHEDKQEDFRPRTRVIWPRVAWLWIIIGLILLNLVCLSINCRPATAGAMESAPADSGLNQETAIRAILGEAGSSYEEMRAIAWAIANRGHFLGVYGLRTVSKDFIKNADDLSGELIQRASRAWNEAGSDNHGGDHWLSDYDLKHCKSKATAFRFAMTEVAYRGTTHFYRS